MNLKYGLPLVAAVLGLCPISASAQNVSFIVDNEPNNNSLATGTFLDFQGRGTLTGICSLTPNDEDHFRVSLAAGDTLNVMTTPLGGLPTGFGTPDTIVTIRDTSDMQLASDGDAGSDFPGAGGVNGSCVRYRAPSAGTYVIRVTGLSDTQNGRYFLMVSRPLEGSAELAVSKNSNDTVGSATQLNLGLSGPLNLRPTASSANDIDFFAQPMALGDVLSVTLSPIDNLPTNWGSPDPSMSIVDTNGTTVLVTSTNDLAGEVPSGANRGCTIRFRAPSTGTYYVRVNHDAIADIRTYALALALAPAAACPGDANGDGFVSFPDITNVLQNWGDFCP